MLKKQKKLYLCSIKTNETNKNLIKRCAKPF